MTYSLDCLTPNQENPSLNPLAAVLKLGQLRCINQYLVIESSVYVNEWSLHSNCSVAECFPEKSSWH